MAGVEGFEPPNGGIKTRCLTAWRHPSELVSGAASGERFRPRTTYPIQRCGNRPSTSRARASSGSAAKTHEPVPVSRAGANCPSQSSASATAGKRRRTTGSQSLRPPASRKPRIVIAGESLVNSGALNTSAVLTVASGRTSRKTGSGRSSGVNCSPTPSPHAARPWTNTGTSAPSARPSCASSSGVLPSPHNRLRATNTVAASELPPPTPPCIGSRLCTSIATPGRSSAVPAASSRAARTHRSCSAGTPASSVIRSTTPGGRRQKRS